MKKIAIVAGARPNFMKVAPVLKSYENKTDKKMFFIHTGQHYDFSMSDVFFKELDLRKPDAFLGVGSGSHGEQTAKIMIEFEKWCMSNGPDAVIVAGDVNSTMACSLVAAKLNIPSAHIESGLRSFDRTMPEEINRLVTDQLSELLFITSKDAEVNLKKENAFGKIYFVGNSMIDSLVFISEKLDGSTLDSFELTKGEYCLVTLHRPSNVDSKENLFKICDILLKISDNTKVIFPVHPRTLKNLKSFSFKDIFNKSNIQITEPLGYQDFVELEKNAKFVLTDSGGVQEETTFFRVPCITLRPNTERPITIIEGTNELSALDNNSVLEKVDRIIQEKWKKSDIPKLWDGNSGQRIADLLLGWKS